MTTQATLDFQTLNERQRKACEFIILGKTASQSLRLAGYPESATTHSTRWLNSAKVQSYLNYLRDPNHMICSIQERKQRLWDLAKANKQTNPVQAIAELNRMEGVYPAEQHQHQVVVFHVGGSPQNGQVSAETPHLGIQEANKRTDKEWQ